jgi:hypothetical protein
MIPRERKTRTAVALLLVVAVIQLYTGAAASTANGQSFATRPQQASGILSTTGNRDIQADRNSVNTGATILDGMLLETSDCVAATVRWTPVQEAQLATNTIATVYHSDGKVRIVLKQGCAIARGGASDEVTVETPDGKTVTATQLDGDNSKSVQVCYPTEARYDFHPSCFAAAKVGGILAGVAGVIVAVVLLGSNSRGENPSSMLPGS